MTSTADQSGSAPDDARIPRLGFNASDTWVPDFEITDLATVYARMRRRDLGGVHRLDFHTVTLITRGRTTRMVDFVTYPCRPGTLLWTRPGQVQRFGPQGATNGTHLLFTPAFPAQAGGAGRLVDEPYGPVCCDLGTRPDRTAVATLLDQLRAEYERPPGTASQEILRLLLATLLMHLDRLPRHEEERDPRAGGEVYARFRAELERSYATTRRAEDYARRLGYTVKTLTRACLAATGQPVKQVIDERVTLEAQRLLAHTDEPVVLVARRLGFSEATNFGKFFVRHAGTTPSEFRRAHTGRRPPSPD